MPVIREVSGKWTWTVPAFDMPIERGMRMVLESGVVGNKAEAVYRLLDWQYRVLRDPGDGQGLDLDLELIVEEVQPGLWEMWFTHLSADNQFLFPMITGFLVVGLFVLFGGILYLQPTHGLVLIGRYVRTLVGWAIVLFFWFILPKKLDLFSKPPNFRKPFFAGLLNITGWILLGLWLTFSAYPGGFHSSDTEYVAYAKTLGHSLSSSYWPILLAALPWLTVIFKVLGLDVAEKAAEGLQKAAVKEK